MMMKNISEYILAGVAVLCCASLSADDKVKTVETGQNGETVINTSVIGAKYDGFMGRTPVKVTISKKGVVTSVEALPNDETPRYFDYAVAEGLLEKWNGKTVDEALEMKVDAVSGATFSSSAVIKNVRAALVFYKQNCR